MNLGISGARITGAIVKRAPLAWLQAEYMTLLGPEVCPRVLTNLQLDGEEAFVMERCEPFHRARIADYRVVLTLLQERVWNRSPVQPERQRLLEGGPRDWHYRLYDWLEKAGQTTLREVFYHLYPNNQPTRWTMIHGDATLANALVRYDERGDSRVLLSDPLPFGGKVPPLPEVDRGKLLQSALGWEEQLNPSWEGPSEYEAIRAVTEDLGDEEARLAWFWCAVHCLRLVPYAERAERPRLVRWGREHAAAITANLQRGGVGGAEIAEWYRRRREVLR